MKSFKNDYFSYIYYSHRQFILEKWKPYMESVIWLGIHFSSGNDFVGWLAVKNEPIE